MKTLFLLLLSVACASAQNVAVRYLWMDPSHEWHGTNGCPTNMPVAVDSIGTNAVSPYPNRVVVSAAEYTTLTNSLWPTFHAWHTNQWAKFVIDRQAAQQTTRQANIQALLNLYQTFQDYEALASTSTPNNAQVLLEVRRLNGAFLRLGPLLKQIYQGDD